MSAGTPTLKRPVDFKPLREEYNRYELEGGYVLEVKVMVTKVYETEGKEPDGTPHFFVMSSNLLRVLPPSREKQTV